MKATLEQAKRVRVLSRRYYDKLRRDPEYMYSHASFAARDAMARAAQELDIGYGVEGFCLDECGRNGVSYIKMGDTYDVTVLFDTRHERFIVTSWGDYVEVLERQGITLL